MENKVRERSEGRPLVLVELISRCPLLPLAGRSDAHRNGLLIFVVLD